LAQEKAKPKKLPGLKVDPNTTVLTKPLNPLGFPDYVAALNDELRSSFITLN
jgi:hypothetical protein